MLKGMTTFFAGFAMLIGEASLRQVLWRMLDLLLAVMLALMVGVFFLADYLTALWMPEGDAWYWQVVSAVAWLLAVLMALLSGVVGFTALASAAIAPWLDELATRTERLLGKTSQENSSGWLEQSMSSLANSVRPLFGLLVLGIVALLFFWFPPLAAAIWTYASIRFLNFELFDTQASRAGLNFKDRKVYMKQHFWFWLGFGGTALVLMMVPLLNIFIIPAAVVALAQRG